MIKQIICLILVLMISNTLFAQTQAVVLVLRKKTECGIVSDLSYKIVTGERKGLFTLESQSIKEMTKANPGSFVEPTWAESLDTHGTMYQDYLVIISSETVDEKGCRKLTYGVGFGTDQESAMKQAINGITGNDWSWSERKNGYTMLVSKNLFEDLKIKNKQKPAVIGDRG